MTCTHRNKINLITLPPNAHKQKVEIKIEELEIPLTITTWYFTQIIMVKPGSTRKANT